MEYRGAICHVTVRSNGGTALFGDDKDRWYLLGRIAEAAELNGVLVYVYCLMRNHVHLALETPRGNLGRFMQGVLTGYGVYYNRRHWTHGHVTQGRYGAKLVEGNEYLLKLSRYVHLNPVKVEGMRREPVVERLEALRSYPGQATVPEDASLRRQRRVCGVEAVLVTVARMTGVAVSCQLKHLAHLLESDGDLAAVVRRIERRLDTEQAKYKT